MPCETGGEADQHPCGVCEEIKATNFLYSVFDLRAGSMKVILGVRWETWVGGVGRVWGGGCAGKRGKRGRAL